MKLSFLILFYTNGLTQPTTVNWRDDGSNGNWEWGSSCDGGSDGNWNYPSWGGNRRRPDCYGNHRLNFNGNGWTVMNLNSTTNYGVNWITFNSGATTARTIGSDAGRTLFLNANSGDPKIENNSSATHTFSVPITLNNWAEFNPINGDLTFSGNINMNGQNLNVWGNNSKLITFSGILSGTNSKLILNQNSKLLLSAINTYTGNTEINAGELWIGNGGDISSSSSIFLGNGGATATVAKLWLSNPTGGTTFSRNVTVNQGNTTTRYIGGLNTSGTHTFSGNIINNSTTGGLYLSALSSGGTTAFSGEISGGGAVLLDGLGTVVLSNSGNTYSGGTTILSGTLSISNAGNLGNTSGAIRIGNGSTTGTLNITSSLSRTALNVTDGSTAGVINVASGQTFTLSNLNTSSGTNNTTKIGKSGPGTLTLSGIGTYVGQTQVGDGTVIVSNNSGLGTNNSTTARGIDLGLNVGDVSQGNNVSVLATDAITVPQSIYVAPNTSAATRTIGLSGASGTATFSNEIYLDGNLTVTGTGTVVISGRLTNTFGIIANATTVTLQNSANNYTGTTQINSGSEVRLNPTANATFASQVVLNGGTLSTTSITASRTWTSSSTIQLLQNSIITLQGNAHTISFAASNAVSWTSGRTLTINGWTGTYGGTGTGGKIFIGSNSSGLTASQLAQIIFTGFGPATILSTGEIVPAVTEFRSNVATGNWNAIGSWEMSTDGGTSWVAATVTPSSIHNTITIRNTHQITVTADVTIDQVTVANGGLLIVNSGITLTVANGTGTDLSVDGRVRNAGGITTTGTVSFSATGTYEHNFTTTSGVIPTATWQTGSTCKIIGYTSYTGPFSSTNGWSQSFSNFEWATTSQANTINWQMNATTPPTLNGNFIVSNCNGQILRLSSSGTFTLNIGGDLILSSTSGSSTLNLSNGGTATLNIGGNFTQSQTANSQSLTSTGAGTRTINFNNASGTQTITQSGGTISGSINWNVGTGTSTNTVELASNVNLGTGTGTFTVRDKAKFDAKTFVLSGSNAVTSNAGSTIITAHASGLNGSITSSGTKTLNAGTNYKFNAGIAQVTGAFLTAANNVEIDNTAGLSLSANTTISGILTFTNGILTTTSSNLLSVSNTSSSAFSGVNASKYIDGPVRWTLPSNLVSGSTYVFPVGKASTYYPFSLVNPVTGATGPAINVEAFQANSGGGNGTDVVELSTTEYWNATVNSGNLTSSSVSIAKQSSLGTLDIITRSTTISGTYNNLNGTVSGNSIINSDNVGSSLGFFTFGRLGVTSSPPTLTAAVGATVDAPFNVTFVDNAPWRAAITSVTVGGTTLSPSAYSVTSGQITFTPSASTLLQSSGTKSIVVVATGYTDATVSQAISSGAANKLAVSVQPLGPSSNGGALATQPVILIQDQYGNVTTSTATVNVSVGAGTWILGGTTSQNGESGTVTFTNLTATSAAAVTGATISFTSAGLTGVTSSTFNITAPAPANDLCDNVQTLIIGGGTVSGTLAQATNSTNSFTYGTTKNDVWYTFTAQCSGSHTIQLTFSSGPDIDMDLFTSASCPTSGTAGSVAHGSSTTETITANLTSGSTYYIRVIDWYGNAESFNIGVTTSVSPTFTLANTGTPAVSNRIQGDVNVPLFGFALTPNACSNSFDFTAASIATSGTATSSDFSNFRLIQDANANGVADAGEISSPLGTVASLANPLVFSSISGQTGITSVRRYLLIADVAVGATPGNTITATLSAANTTASVTVSGSANGNAQTVLQEASKLVITAISPTTPVAGSTFSVTVQSQNASNVAVNLLTTTTFDLSINTGSLSGTVTGTITAGSNSVTVTGVIPSSQGTGVTVTATRNAGATLSAGTSAAFTILATQPTAAITALQFANTTTSGFDVSFTPASGTPDGYIVLRRATSAPTGTLVDGTTYTLGSTNVAGGTNTVAYVGSSTSFIENALASGSLYQYSVFSYNGSGATINYFPTALTGSGYTYALEPTAHSNLFSISSFGTASVTFNIQALTGITNGSGYNILYKTGTSAPTTLPSDGAAFASSGDAILGANTTTTGITTLQVTGLTAGTEYTFILVPYGRGGTVDATRNYKIDGSIPTITYKLPNSNSDVVSVSQVATISSIINDNAPLSSSTGVEVWSFSIRDGGASQTDTDNLPTKVSTITISRPVTSSIDFSANIKTAALFDNSDNFIATVSSTTATTLVFSGLNLSIANNSSQTYKLRISLNNTLSPAASIDGSDLGFSISNANIIAPFDGTSSAFSSFSAAQTNNNQLVISVDATKLNFVQEPSNTTIGASMTPAVTVSATDVNGNRDVNFNSSITLTSSTLSIYDGGTLSGGVATASVGIATFSSLSFSALGSTLTLTAKRTGTLDWDVNSSTTFNVTDGPTVLAAGDIAIIAMQVAASDKLAFVVLKEINQGTEINFTDNGMASTTTGRTGEGFLTYTAPSDICAGTVITWQNGQSISGTGWSSSSPSNFALSNTGDQIFAFQGSTSNWGSQSGITLLYAFQTGNSWITNGTASTTTSYSPSSLNNSYEVQFTNSSETDVFLPSTPSTNRTPSEVITFLGDGSNYTKVNASFTMPTYTSFPMKIANVTSITAISSCAGASTSTVTFTSPSLKNGTYTVTYNLTGANTASSTTASMDIVSGVGTFTATGISNNGLTVLNISKVSKSGCEQIVGSTVNIYKGIQWLGTVDSEWSNTSNWNPCGIATASTDLVIASGTPFYPEVTSTTAALNSLTINSGATFTVSGTGLLQIATSITNTGTINAGGTIEFNGASQSIPAITFNNLKISGSGSKTLTGTVTVSNELNLNNGTLTLGANSLVFDGNSIVRTSGSIDASNTSATLVFSNASDLTLPTGIFSAAVNNLTLSNKRVIVNNNFTVNGTLSLNAANPDATNGLLDLVQSYDAYANVHSVNSTDSYNNLSSYVLTLGADATVTGTGDVTGKIRRTAFVSGATYAFGNANMTLRLVQNGGTLPSQITVVATRGDEGLHVDKNGSHDTGPNGLIGGAAVKRLHQVLRTGGTSEVRFTVRFPYSDSELNGNTESNLVTWDHHLPYGGMTPHEHGKTSINTTDNYVELADHGLFYLAEEGNTGFTKYWMLSDKVSADTLWLGAAGESAGTQWSNGINWSSGVAPTNWTKIVIDPTLYNNQLTLSGTPTAGTMYIKQGAVVNGGSSTLTLNSGPADNGGVGTWINEGTFNAESSTVVFNYADATIAGATDFNNLTINTAKKLTIQEDAIIGIKGALTMNGIFDASSNTNEVKYIGSGQTIYQANGTVLGYSGLTIAQSSGNATLGERVTVIDDLKMNGGNLTTSPTNILEIGTSASKTGNVNWTAGSVVGPMKRWFGTSANSTQGSGLFPVGLADQNRLAVINFTESTAGGYIVMEYKSGAPSVLDENDQPVADPFGLPLMYMVNGLRNYIQNADLTGYWDITPYSSAGVAYDALDVNTFDITLRINSDVIQNNPVTANPPGMRIIRAKGNPGAAHDPFEIGATTATITQVPGSDPGTDFYVRSNNLTGFSWFNIGGDNETPLPVELLSFNGNCENEQIQLIWKTASENNSDYFEVLKSQDGENWRVMNTQAAAGFSTSLQTYSYTELENSEEAYYRLNQVDINGDSKLYDLIYVDCNGITDELKTYPNPSSNGFNIALNDSKLKGESIIVIRDAMGKVILEKSIFVEEGINLYPISSNELANGIYFITIENQNTQSKTIKHSKN